MSRIVKRGESELNGDVEISTMCAVILGQKVLMINRNKTWKGWAFPGGHLEEGESITDCVKREMYEETGIRIGSLVLKGFVSIYNTENNKRHFVYNYVSRDIRGTVKKHCDEGDIEWIDISKINDLPLAEGMEYRIPLFLGKTGQELYIEWNSDEGCTSARYFEVSDKDGKKF